MINKKLCLTICCSVTLSQ